MVMANYCLLPHQIDSFKQALKEKDINIGDLLNMDTGARTEVFKKYAGDNAKAVNTLFEEKLLLKNRMLGIQNLFSKLGEFGKNSAEHKAELAKTLAEYRAAQQERVFSPKEHEAFLNDIADKRIGTHITQEQAAKVFELTKKVADTKETNQLSGLSPEHIQARQELNNYVKSVDAPTALESIGKNAAIIGRNNLLMNPATPLKSLVGQVVNATMEKITRTLTNLSAERNSDLVKQARSEAMDTYKKTGVNTAAMESVDDTHILGKGEDFKLPTQPTNRATGLVEKVVRKTAALSNKLVIDLAHNQAFTRFYQRAFFDTANIHAGTLAKIEGLSGAELTTRARDIFKDSVKVKPETAEGAMVRHLAQEQAARVTSTNDTLASRFSLASKNALNKVIPGFPLGDLVLPIAKIPASIIANGIDNAGFGIPLGVKDFFEGRSKLQSSDLETRLQGAVQYAKGTQRLLRIGGTIGTAALLTSGLKKEDFRSDNYGNHFVKIGHTWINTEYISAISPSLSGFMSAKAHEGKGAVNAAGQYSGGVLSSLKNIPGVDEANSLITSISNTDVEKGVKKYVSDFFTSRGEPAFIKNIANNRPINRLFFGATGAESEQAYNQDVKDKAAKAAAARKANK